MKCPKCGYNTFEYLDACKKCGKDLIAFKESLGIKPVVLSSRLDSILSSPAGDDSTFGGSPVDDNAPAFDLPPATPTHAVSGAKVSSATGISPEQQGEKPFSFEPEATSAASEEFGEFSFEEFEDSVAAGTPSQPSTAAPGEFDLDLFSSPAPVEEIHGKKSGHAEPKEFSPEILETLFGQDDTKKP